MHFSIIGKGILKMKTKRRWIIVSLCLTLVFVFMLQGNKLPSVLENFLIIDEEPKPADVIIVLGGGSGERVDYGVRLYQSGYATKLLLTGGPCGWETTEAKFMERLALSLGVPKDNILLEEESLSTYENARYTLEIMRAKKFESAILVTSPYHTKRASMIFRRFFIGIDLTTCSVPYNSSDPGNWWLDSRRVRDVASEYLKLGWYYLFGA